MSKVMLELARLLTVSVASKRARLRLVGPQPYLVEPDKYLEVIRCVATERYLPAKDLLAAAQVEVANTKDEIERLEKLIKERIESIEKDFKAELGTPIDCTRYRRKARSDDDCKSPPMPSTNRC